MILSRLGSGTYVLAPDTLSSLPKNDTEAPWPLWQQSLQEYRNITRSRQPKQAKTRHPQPVSFASGIGDANMFPAEEFRKVLQSVMRRDGFDALDYGERNGYGPLRESITQGRDEYRQSADAATRAACDLRTILRRGGKESDLCQETRNWIEMHDAFDRERIIQEEASGERERVRQNALNKLTLDERRALGL